MKMNRRDLLKQATAAMATHVAWSGGPAAKCLMANEPSQQSATVLPQFRYCLNTSTIAGHRNKTPLAKEIELVAKVGYSGIEPWIREITVHRESGGKLSDLRKRCQDHGIAVESAIGFANWLADDDAERKRDDDAERKRGLEALRRDMDLVRQIGGTRIAAPPVGAPGRLDLNVVAERYAAALRVGKEMGVTPMLELWGHSATLHRLGEIMYVMVEANEPNAAMLLDVYHIYRGGSDFSGLRHVDGVAVQVLHMNDYPSIPFQDIKDKDRVYVGDGVAPVPEILRTMRATGFRGVLSLELFNPTYWKDDVEHVLRKGLESMKQAVAKV